MKQLRVVWRCETNGSYFVLNLAADQTVALQQHVSNIYQSTFLEKKKTETKMTASVLKQDPNA